MRSLTRMALLVALSLVGCGHADIGEPCDKPGSTDDCVDGAVCTNDSGGNLCRQLCNDTAQCAAGFACNGVSGTSLKSCQPDKTK